MPVCVPIRVSNSWSMSPKVIFWKEHDSWCVSQESGTSAQGDGFPVTGIFPWMHFSGVLYPIPLFSSLPLVWEHCSHKGSIKDMINSVSFVFYPIINAGLINMGRNWGVNHSAIWDDGKCSYLSLLWWTSLRWQDLSVLCPHFYCLLVTAITGSLDPLQCVW